MAQNDKRYTMDCREAGEGCSLTLSGTYDEVLQAGVAHAQSAHGMKGDDAKIREDVKGFIKEQPRTGESSFGAGSQKPRGAGYGTRPS